MPCMRLCGWYLGSALVCSLESMIIQGRSREGMRCAAVCSSGERRPHHRLEVLFRSRALLSARCRTAKQVSYSLDSHLGVLQDCALVGPATVVAVQ